MARSKPVNVGLIGSGAISGEYLRNMTKHFSVLHVVGCSDIVSERSRARAEEFGIRQMTNRQILEDPEIDIVVNTTYPTSHYEVTKAALLAGKHVHTEKMLAVTWDEGKELYQLARERGLRLGCAPDTFLGGGYQTARKLIDAGMIGQPLTAQAMVVRGYHMNAERDMGALAFVMQPGGGIPFDMGGYYLHAMIALLGGIKRVSGFAKTREKEYRFRNPRHPRYKQEFDFGTPNMLTGALEFENGCYGSLTAVSEGFGETPRLEIYGDEGILICHDPNLYGAPIYLVREGPEQTGRRFEMPFTHGYLGGGWRGIGVADMAYGILNARPHRAGGDIGLHAFEAVHGIWKSGRGGSVYEMTTRCERPRPLASGFMEGTLAEACLDD